MEDFVKYLPPDMTLNILKKLNDPADLCRVSAVSWSWYHFVLDNRVSKHLCLKLLPQLSIISRIVEPRSKSMNELNNKSSKDTEHAILEREHKVCNYMFKLLFVTKELPTFCDIKAVSSSTYKSDYLIIQRTMYPGCSYWSSKGHIDPHVTETLIYNLNANKLSMVSQINVRAFQDPISKCPAFTPRFMRFRMGYRRYNSSSPNEWVWTYTSPKFDMEKDRLLQEFKLPEPVLCIGGFLQIELLDMVERETNGLFYIRIENVGVLGRTFNELFDVEIQKPSGEFLLNYHPELLLEYLMMKKERKKKKKDKAKRQSK